MPLKRKKGFRIEVKTQTSRLLRVGFELSETNALFSDIARFWLLIIADDPNGVEAKDPKRYYEPQFFSPEATQTFPFDCPQPFRRATLAKAIGIYKSWRSNYQKWTEREAKRIAKTGKPSKKHRPPTLPTELRLNATLYAGMFKEDDGRSIVLKIVVKGAWKWIKFSYQSPQHPEGWSPSTPALVTKSDGSVWLNWVVERYQPATGGLVHVMQDGNRICAVDLDLDGELAKCAVYDVEVNGELREVARMATSGHKRHTALRKSRLGKIAKSMNQTRIINKGFASTRWQKVRNAEQAQARKQARLIVEFAARYGCAAIVFEHLTKLRPQKGRYSRRSNRKRAYWLKAALWQQVARIARQDHNILTARVNPRDTSNTEALSGAPVMRVSQMWQAQWLAFDEENWDSYQQTVGYHPGALAISRSGKIINAGLNACRNIALKFCHRYYSKPLLVTGWCDEGSIQAVARPI